MTSTRIANAVEPPNVGVSRPATSRAPRRPRRSRGQVLLPYVLILPGGLIVGAFVILAIVYTVRSSFTDWDASRLSTSWVGLDNYSALLKDPDFRASLVRAAVFVLGVILISLVSGFLIAVLLDAKFPGRTAVRMVVVAPWVLSEIAVGVVWSLVLAPEGIAQRLLSHVGVDVNPLGGAHSAMVALVLVECWRSVGLVTVLILAGLQAVNPELYEAATIDGAGAVRRRLSITLPLVRPTIMVAAILLLIGNFNLVSIIFALTGGGPVDATSTTALYMYNESFKYFHFGYASAVAVTMSIINMIAMVIFMAVGGRQEISE